jgi:glycosyltransferase involved in cell wall biosynthesis
VTARLAVCVPVVGLASETFIRRHVEQLLPSRTVVIARRPAPGGEASWSTGAPTLWLDPLLDEWGGEPERAAVDGFLREHGVTTVLMEYLDIWLPFLSTFAGLGLTRVAHAHGYDVSSRLRDEHWRAAYRDYRDVDAVVAPSQHSRARLLDIGLSPDLVRVVPCGVDVPTATTRPARAGVDVLAAGRLVAKKNPLATIEACDRAARAGADIALTVIGDGPLMPAVRQAAGRAAVPVQLLGARPASEVLAAMASADVFCQHSVVDPRTGDEEGLPVAILEAMAHALPVVSTRHAGIPDAVIDGETGLLVDEGDVDAMAAGLVALARDPALRRRLGAAGRARVQARFTWARERDALRRLLAVDGCHDVPMTTAAQS